MPVTLLTGMSGTGKSTVIAELARRGHRAVDLDEDGWSHWAPCEGNPTGANPGHDWVWGEERLNGLLDAHKDEVLFIGGCAPNMGRFRPRIGHIVLLTAPIEVILERVAHRSSNPYGKTPEERDRIIANHKEVEPVLRQIATLVIDAAQPVDKVVAEVLQSAASRPAERAPFGS